MNAEKKIDKKYVETPLMKQYYSIKAVHPDAILLFRVGDFYETFGEDAINLVTIFKIHEDHNVGVNGVLRLDAKAAAASK